MHCKDLYITKIRTFPVEDFSLKILTHHNLGNLSCCLFSNFPQVSLPKETSSGTQNLIPSDEYIKEVCSADHLQQ